MEVEEEGGVWGKGGRGGEDDGGERQGRLMGRLRGGVREEKRGARRLLSPAPISIRATDKTCLRLRLQPHASRSLRSHSRYRFIPVFNVIWYSFLWPSWTSINPATESTDTAPSPL